MVRNAFNAVVAEVKPLRRSMSSNCSHIHSNSNVSFLQEGVGPLGCSVSPNTNPAMISGITMVDDIRSRREAYEAYVRHKLIAASKRLAGSGPGIGRMMRDPRICKR